MKFEIPSELSKRFIDPLPQRARGEVQPTLKAAALAFSQMPVEEKYRQACEGLRVFGLVDAAHVLPPPPVWVPRVEGLIFDAITQGAERSFSASGLVLAIRMCVHGGMFADGWRIANGLLQFFSMVEFCKLSGAPVGGPMVGAIASVIIGDDPEAPEIAPEEMLEQFATFAMENPNESIELMEKATTYVKEYRKLRRKLDKEAEEMAKEIPDEDFRAEHILKRSEEGTPEEESDEDSSDSTSV